MIEMKSVDCRNVHNKGELLKLVSVYGVNMKILRNNRRAFALMGFLSDERIFAFPHGHTIANFLFVLILVVEDVTSITYMMRHLKIGDMQNALYASLQIPAVVPAIVILITMMYDKDKVRDVIGGFQKICDQCNPNHIKLPKPNPI